MRNVNKSDIEKLKNELSEKLTNGVKAMLNSDTYKEYLNFASKIPNRSFNNQLLIWLQNPNATLCKGFRQWNEEFDRHVKEGEKGIKIFAPSGKGSKTFDDIAEFEKFIKNNSWWFKMSENRQAEIKAQITVNGEATVDLPMTYKVVSVFDVSQTEGKEIEEPKICQLLEGNVASYEKLLNDLKAIALIPVEFRSESLDPVLKDARGYYSPVTDSIVLRDGMSEAQTISTLVHEIAHSIMHSKEMKEEGVWDSHALKDIKELQAESVSYMVCQRLGIETETKTFGYIASWIDTGNEEETMKKMKDNMDIIGKCAESILNRLKEQSKELVHEDEEVELC